MILKDVVTAVVQIVLLHVKNVVNAAAQRTVNVVNAVKIAVKNVNVAAKNLAKISYH